MNIGYTSVSKETNLKPCRCTISEDSLHCTPQEPHYEPNQIRLHSVHHKPLEISSTTNKPTFKRHRETTDIHI